MSKSNLKVDIINQITKESERDKQRRVGPSDIGNPCPKCLGRALAGDKGDGDFSLYPWIGTSVHYYLEDNSFPDGEHELKLYVGDIDGYGPVKGTTDLYLPATEPEVGGTIVDWKIVGLKKIKTYRASGVPEQYRYQGQLYARGCILAGKPVDTVAICFIPRDSGNVNDIFVHEEAYQPEMVEAILARAGRIYAIVQESGWADLPSHDDCYTCNMTW